MPNSNDEKRIEVAIIHKVAEEEKSYQTKTTLRQSSNSSIQQTTKCQQCEEEVSVTVRSTKSIRRRYLLLMLPSIILGAYFTINKAMKDGTDTIILSVIIYVIVGVMLYLAVMVSIFRSLFSVITVNNSPSHTIELE